MNEHEAAERFCREIDALIEGAASPELVADEGLLAAARRLAQADFSAESRIRAGLRARLLDRARRSAEAGERRNPAPPLSARLAFSMAALAIALCIPLRGILSEPAVWLGSEGLAMGRNGLPVLPGRLPVRIASAAATPIETKPIDRLIETRPVDGIIEVRSISREELFQKPVLAPWNGLMETGG